MKKIFVSMCLLLIISLALAAASPALAQSTGPVPLSEIDIEQKLNAQIPLNLEFQNEAGQTIWLREYFGQKPIVLVFAYYECPMLCTLVLNDLTKAMQEMSLEIGNQFEVVTVSIDPRETPELASAKKKLYTEEYGRPGPETGWHFLTGEEAAIQKVTEAVGFRYVYDAIIDQYAHPAAVIVLTPDGRISHYLGGLGYSGRDLRLSLVEASDRKIASPVDQFFLMCYEYNPASGQYNLVIHQVTRLFGIAILTALAILVLALVLKERRNRDVHPPAKGLSG